MMEHLNSMEGQENLRIVEHLDMQKLPESLQQMLSLATTPEERDILLMSTLAGTSACVPNIYFRYGPTGKKYYANLQCFILAAAASGKGIQKSFRDSGIPVHRYTVFYRTFMLPTVSCSLVLP